MEQEDMKFNRSRAWLALAARRFRIPRGHRDQASASKRKAL